MMNFALTEQHFAAMERGEPRLKAMREAILEADTQGDVYWRFRLRFDYLKESIFCGDRYFAMIMFPELLALYDAQQALQDDEECAYWMLVAFKWVVEAAPEFPQISKAEIDSYFRLFKRRLLEQGCSLSIYYMKRSLFYMHCDPGIAAADFYRYLDAPLDDISDGKALYYDQQVIFYLSIGEEEKALVAAKPIFSGEMISNALPQSTYCEFLKFYLRKGDFEEAQHYAALMEPLVDGDPYYLEAIGFLMTLYSLTEPVRGLALFQKHYPLYMQSRNPLLRMLFAMGAHRLFAAAKSETSIQVPKESPLYAAAGEGDFSEISAHFYAAAKELAQKFDARNGTEDFMKLLHFNYPKQQKEEV